MKKFELSEEECKLANDWMDGHETKHGPNKDIIGGSRYSFVFEPFRNDYWAWVRCYICKEEHELRSWYP